MMKKFLFSLLVVLTLLLCAGTAMAASHPCDLCDGETRLVGTGEWCHWYCESCDYTTSRNHDPNSAYSGLVPDSCSGYCSWCGRAADYSSHTFAGYVYNGDATCFENGTETGKCTNAQCSATHTRVCENSALGHSFKFMVTLPTCETYGVTTDVCSACGHRQDRDYVEPLGHSFTNWRYNGDGTHTAACDREGCRKTESGSCEMKDVVVGGKTISFCFACSHMENGESSTLPVSVNGLMLLVDAMPLDVELKVDTPVLYMIVISSAQELTEKTSVEVDLKEYPFEAAEGWYANLLPEQLDAEKLNLFYVGMDQTADLTQETWYPCTFTLAEGVLSFDTDELGVYLLVPAAE